MSTAPARLVTRWIVSALMLTLAQPLLHAEAGMCYVGDLNGDGIADRLESGPLTFFGNAGGPFVLTLSSVHGAQRFDVEGHGTFAREVIDGHTFRLWSYSRISASAGHLITYSITDGKMTMAYLLINPGDSGTDLGNTVFEAVFAGKARIIAERIDDYAPPSGPARGGEWGK